LTLTVEGNDADARDRNRRTICELTPFGAAILAGKANFIGANGINDWVLGVRLDSRSERVWYRTAGRNKRLLVRA
jgi:hypothetical protein